MDEVTFNSIIKYQPGESTDDESDDDSNYVRRSRNSRSRRQKISTDVWNFNNITQLIAEVEVRPCLWDEGDKNHNNRNQREAEWRSVAEVFENRIPVQQITAKWQSLRTQYRNNVSNAQKTEFRQKAARKPRWKFQDQMAFISASKKMQTVMTELNVSTSAEGFGDTVLVESSNASHLSVSSSTITTTSGFAQRNSFQYKGRDAIIMSGIKSVVDVLDQKLQPPDDVQTFGNLIVSKLRTIQDANYREQTQRHLLNLLWERLENQPVEKLIFV